MGITPEASHHEEGPGQHEIDFKHSSPLKAADNATTFKSVVKTMASINGLCASFEPKPLKDSYGNGFHVNISPKCENRDIFDEFLAGILDHIKEITAFLNPKKESYLRFGAMKAPKYITWSHENRSQLIRIPAANSALQRRIELRSPDPTANPYLAFALLIYASLCGLKNEIMPPVPANVNLFSNGDSISDSFKKLPQNLNEAVHAASVSEFIAKHLPESIICAYCSQER